MSGFDPAELAAAVTRQGAVVRVVIAEHRGSTPREAGTAMLVWEGGQSGTIGGGALEWEAARAALRLLGAEAPWARQVLRLPLGPGLGQCCGGQVTLLMERFGAAEVAALAGLAGGYVRPVEGGAAPLAASAEAVRLGGGVMSEPLAEPALPLWLWGAGHVGRAVVHAAQGLPLAITWIDTGAERFPGEMPVHAAPLVAADPARAVGRAPDPAAHLVMTYSHAMDLDICHAVLSRRARYLGLIGSASKRARFVSRLRELGHGEAALERLVCPIGERALGKIPAAIALGVVREMLLLGAAEARPMVRSA